MCRTNESHESTCDWLRERNKSLRSDEALWERMPWWAWALVAVFVLAVLARIMES